MTTQDLEIWIRGITGFNAPLFIWGISSFIILFTVITIIALLISKHRIKSVLVYLQREFGKIRSQFPLRPFEGLKIQAYDAVATFVSKEKFINSPWVSFDSQLIRTYATDEGSELIWSGESSINYFDEKNILDTHINRSFFSSVPAILTGIGLLSTFIALLLALKDLRPVAGGAIEGIDVLIKGLSGKFISSIVALGCATFYIFIEKAFVFHPLEVKRKSLCAEIDRLFPIMTSTRLLSNINANLSNQSIAFQQFNTDLAVRLTTSVSEGIGPSISQMVSVIDNLNQLLRATEERKQESMTGSISNLITKLESSISSSLLDMGKNFSQSLSGSTLSQFEEISKSLKGAGKLIEDMNLQSQSTQAALSEIISHARNSTSEQMELGKNQVQELTLVLRGLMSQISESTGSSLEKVSSTLTTVVHQLSEEVSGLNRKMSQNFEETTGKATNAAATVIKQAGVWSENNNRQLTDLLEKYQAQFSSMADLRSLLDQSLGKFKIAVDSYSPIITDMKQVSGLLSELVMSTSQTTKEMGVAQENFQKVARLTADQVQTLGDANSKQNETWQRIQGNMETYKQVFSSVEGEAEGLFEVIDSGLKRYGQTSAEHFQNIVSTTDNLVSNAVKKLHDLVNELAEIVEELNEKLDKKAS